ncbi:uncharacterized protein N7469_002907 [Penicillium citrinum]|uniref:WHIM1 domain-containing protein n=1 Tax=Penicillium citrinum TaxID=5077 RepID=A0A9W9PC95_PENCI|nr:uncharacterized protein N7469_002907 [Penicillium citrinum]KAJ5241316.1 hypothetical protein N7469_002907 [Penicillium citrinum]
MSPSDSDSSSLSSAPPTDDETAMEVDEPTGIAKYFKKESSTPPPKREPSPPHEYVIADNPGIAFIVMFRARFDEAFPKALPHYGPQDIERGAVDSPPGEYIERLLCALLGLVLNRKKDVERNHYTRPLEEAIQTHQSQWPKLWAGKSPLSGGRTFATMLPEERIELLRSLALWSLSSSEAIQARLKESYKQARHDDDLNQPLAVQPWGRDSLKRRYWLIEGKDDTHFRLYRESNPALKHVTWWSVAGDIPELQAMADKLQEEKGTNSKKLSERIRSAIPRFEASEEKRKRRDYRIARKAAFSRPEPGFSMYEGRTRGKKLKYTYSDDEEFLSDEGPSRRSARNTSTTVTPAEPSRPRFTASGRQIRSRAGGLYGEALLAGQHDDYEEEAEDQTRPQRARTSIHPNGYSGYGVDDLEDESEAASSGNESGNDWKGGDDDDNDMEGDDEGDDASGDESIANGEPPSLVVQLRYGKGKGPSVPVPVDKPPPAEHVKPHEMSRVEIPVKSSAPEPQSRPSYAPEAMVNPPEPSKPEQMVEVPSFVPPTPVPQSDPLAAQAVPASTGPSTQEIPSPASADPPKHNNVGEFGDSRGPAFGTGD